MERRWRLILDGKHGAAANMAADEAILRAHVDGKVPPTLRLYGWEKPAVSLGYFQSMEGARIDVEYCRDAGIEIVRRPTGGRAVLHGHDLTFSISLDERQIADGFRSVLGSHLWLMGAVVAGLRMLGLEAEIGPANGRAELRDSADCFAHVAECDVRVGREKVAGAAQVRRLGGVLQQGSMPCAVPAVEAARVFGHTNTGLRENGYLLAGAARRDIEQALVQGFEDALQVSFVEGTLTGDEIELALQLQGEKYASPEWTYRRGTCSLTRVC